MQRLPKEIARVYSQRFEGAVRERCQLNQAPHSVKTRANFTNMESSGIPKTEETLMDRTGSYGALVISVIRNVAEKHGGILYLDSRTTFVDHISLPHATIDVCRREMRELLIGLEHLLALRSENPESYLSLS